MKCLELTDKTKTCLDILLETQMDVCKYFKAPLKPEKSFAGDIAPIWHHRNTIIPVPVYQG